MKRSARDFTVALVAGVIGSALWALIAGKAHSIGHLPHAVWEQTCAASTETGKPHPGRGRLRRLSSALLALGLVTGGAVAENAVTSGPASANSNTITLSSLGYPWANAPCKYAPASNPDEHSPSGNPDCKNPSNLSNEQDWFSWGEYVNGTFEPYRSPGGYEYDNCTDFVAWKIDATGGSVPNGLGDGGSWYTKAPAADRKSSPEPGYVAVSPSLDHVAYIESVNAGGTITVEEYNQDEEGKGDIQTGTPASMGFTEYLNFGGSPGGGSGGKTPPSSPDLYEVQHNNSSNGMTQVKEFNGSADFTTWVGGWTTPDGEHAGTDVSYVMSNDNGIEDIYEIQSRNTNSGMTEIKEFDGADNFRTWAGGWVSVDGEHNTADVSYVVGTENSNGHANIYEIQHQNTNSGMTEIKEFDGADNYSTWVGGWVTPDGLHSSNDVDYVSSTCGTTGAPNIYEIQHNDTASGRTEVKEFDGRDNYTTWVGGWTTPDGEHAGTDVSYVAAGCNSDGHPNIYEIQSQNTNSGMTEVKEFNGATDFTTWIGGWVTPDGEHSTSDVAYVMSQ
jgi:surface antigen